MDIIGNVKILWRLLCQPVARAPGYTMPGVDPAFIIAVTEPAKTSAQDMDDICLRLTKAL